MALRLPLIDKVPFEIWEEIFKHSCSGLSRLRGSHRYGVYPEPVVVSHVCTTWRDIAISTAQLWTDISLCLAYRAHISPIHLMSLFLQRSRDKPLSITFKIHHQDMESQPPIHEFLVALFAAVTRWKAVVFDITFGKISVPLWKTLYSMVKLAPLLESLDLKLSCWDDGDIELCLPSQMWMNSPALTKLAVLVQQTGFYLDVSLAITDWTMHNNIPYSQITHLLLDSGRGAIIQWKDIASIFGTAPNLVSCFLNRIARPQSSIRTPIVLRYLQHLYLEADHPHHIQLIPQLNCILTAPFLKTLSFISTDEPTYAIGDIYPEEQKSEMLIQFLTRSSCPLEKIHFIQFYIPPYVLLRCLPLLPQLKTLHWHLDNEVNSDFIRRMAEWDASSNGFVICPNLEELSFSFVRSCGCKQPFMHVTDMLKKRLRPPNGSIGTFRTFACSRDEYIEEIFMCLHPLYDHPWCLNHVDDIPATDYPMKDLWEFYGGK